MNTAQNISIAIPARWSISVRLTRNMPAMAVLILGLITLYGVGFSTATRAHNAAHDTRHATGFPCH